MTDALIPSVVLVLLVAAVVLWAAVLVGIGVLKRYRVRVVGDEGGRTALGSAGIVWLMRVYARWWHRLDATGMDHLGGSMPLNDARGVPLGGTRPVVVVANHTAGIDPVLIQACLGFEVRWMMASDMRVGVLEPLWVYGRIIFVDRMKRDAGSLREALRHLQAGGCLGVFIEGHIARPPRHLLPFKEGAGLLIRKTGALVVPVVVDGTPQAETAWGSLRKRSRSTVRFLEPVDYTKGELGELDAGGITADLRRRFQRATGWPDAPKRARMGEHGRLVWEEHVPFGESATNGGESATLGA